MSSLDLDELKRLGRTTRYYDLLDDEDDPSAIAELMGWVLYDDDELRSYTENKSSSQVEDLINLIESGAAGLDKNASALEALRESKMSSSLFSGLKGLGKDIYDYARNLFAGRKVRTSLTVIGAIVVGVAVGVGIGFATMGIGSVIGGAVGAAITTGILELGGIAGFGIVGGLLGSIMGKKAANKAFKDEKRYELHTSELRRLKKKYGFSNDLSRQLNAYLYNRAKVSGSKICKDHIKLLRRSAIIDGNEKAINELMSFLTYELKLLNKAIERADSTEIEDLQQDLSALKAMLGKLATCKISTKKKLKIIEILQEQSADYRPATATNPWTNPRANPRANPRSVPRANPSTPNMMDAYGNLFRQQNPHPASCVPPRTSRAQQTPASATDHYFYQQDTRIDKFQQIRNQARELASLYGTNAEIDIDILNGDLENAARFVAAARLAKVKVYPQGISANELQQVNHRASILLQEMVARRNHPHQTQATNINPGAF